MDKYILTLKSAGLHGIKKVRYAGDLTSVRLSDEYSVQDYCNTRIKENGAILVLSMATKPQVPEDDDNVLEDYLETKTSVLGDDETVEADGFNAAFCMGTYCIVTSLPFNSFTKAYIDKQSDFAHGLIDVVMFWEDKGYCMRVKTTGRNIRETIAIADILSKRYGRGK